jgi:hypothetical protein
MVARPMTGEAVYFTGLLLALRRMGCAQVHNTCHDMSKLGEMWVGLARNASRPAEQAVTRKVA